MTIASSIDLEAGAEDFLSKDIAEKIYSVFTAVNILSGVSFCDNCNKEVVVKMFAPTPSTLTYFLFRFDVVSSIVYHGALCGFINPESICFKTYYYHSCFTKKKQPPSEVRVTPTTMMVYHMTRLTAWRSKKFVPRWNTWLILYVLLFSLLDNCLIPSYSHHRRS